MTEKTKIMIGKVCNVIATIVFIVFIIVTFAGIKMPINMFIIFVVAMLVVFTICTVIAHFCLKDYKPE